MNKEFISYEQALELKELGFEAAPIGGTHQGSVFYYEDGKLYYDYRPIYSSSTHDGQILAPLYQQAFRWFREKHDLHNGIYPYYDEYEFQIKDFRLPTNIPINGEIMPYEEAELACLIKLIELVKNK